jgi:hypothetical protein
MCKDKYYHLKDTQSEESFDLLSIKLFTLQKLMRYLQKMNLFVLADNQTDY